MTMAHHARRDSTSGLPLPTLTAGAARASAKGFATLLAACALLALPACGSEAPGAGPGGINSTAADGPGVDEGSLGSIELALQLGSARIDSMSYAIVGTGVVMNGSLDVSNSTRVSGVIGGIPFGKNYSLTMNGKGAGKVPNDCSGSASFDVKVVGPTPVPILINCRESQAVVNTTPTPAPVPPFAVLVFAGLLAGLGVALQRRTARG